MGLRRGRERAETDLQDEGSQAEDTGQTGAREGGGLAGTGGHDRGRGGDGSGGDGGNACGRDDADGGVGGVGGDRLGDGARAVGDGQGGGLGDGVGDTIVLDRGGVRAVRRQGGHDLGGVADIVAGLDGSGGTKNSGDGELHFSGWRYVTLARSMCGGRRVRDLD